MDVFSFFLSFVFQLFLILDPVGNMPIFLSLTESNSHKERIKIAKRAVIIAGIVLIFFVLFSWIILSYFGISIYAIQIGGGILLFFIGIEMLYGRNTKTKFTESEHELASKQEDVSVTPLAMPLLAGPGSITTAILFSQSSPFLTYNLILIGGIVIVLSISYLLLANSDKIIEKLGELGTKALVRFMGLMIVFISVQYIINGMKFFFL